MSALRQQDYGASSFSTLGPLSLKVLLGVILITLSAKLRFDLGPVPLTMQTLTIIWLAGIMKTSTGLLALLVYWGAATLGAPVLASADGRLWATFGLTGGYLVGFFLAWLLVARHCMVEVKPLHYMPLFGKALLAHLTILVCGSLWLALATDWDIAWNKGVWPFLLPALIKSLGAAALIIISRRALFGERPLSHGS